MRITIGTILITLTVFLTGCATPRPDTTMELNEVSNKVSSYSKCLKSELHLFIDSAETPQDIADAVAHRCERKLSEYRTALSAFLIASTSPGSQTQYQLLMTEPDRRVEQIREKGRRATISRVIDYREDLSSPK